MNHVYVTFQLMSRLSTTTTTTTTTASNQPSRDGHAYVGYRSILSRFA